MANDVLLEMGTEEIPAKFMPDILSQLENLARQKLSELRIDYGDVKTFGTPRRFSLFIAQLADKQGDKSAETKGPSLKVAFDQDGKPTKAAQGFARGQKVDVSQLVVREGYVYAQVFEAGQDVAGLLPDILIEIIGHLSFPKNMRWADLDVRFVRPIRWIVALHGTEIIPFTIAEVNSGRITRGHRFLGATSITVDNPQDYFVKLKENFVMVDPSERRTVITKQIKELAVAQGGTATIDQDLLEEVVYLVEYPTALCGRFEEKYLTLPPEALITPMREHQRYFPVFAADGKLIPVFITVRNGGREHLEIVQHGNERVLRARLADAEFFFEEDKKIPLDDQVNKLKTIVYQEGLGTLFDKTQRMEKLALLVAREAQIAVDQTILSRSAKLAKADLVTGMVCEFTELQGVMGRSYALLQGEKEAVAEAIFEHYLPRFAGDILPKTAAGRAIGIADKLDNIVATFSRGLIPTGSQDPYALRRQALGIVNILLNGKLHMSLRTLIDQSMDLLNLPGSQDRTELRQNVLDFFALRLKNVLAENQVRYDLIDAVLAEGVDDCYASYLKAGALSKFAAQESSTALIQALVRVNNLAKKDQEQAIDSILFVEQAEKTLYQAFLQVRQQVESSKGQYNFEGLLAALEALRQPIDEFFTGVMVMVEDEAVRNNRLALLKAISALSGLVADFNKIMV
ncbi:glycyl-tRNA synthetase beta chain [Sporomusaceae bacterium BoRhaA]|uniref:glycine--tRNA ligase subunit beta n=1 Tax=Pelorhabdus rhamnosifermentans TaxID=2772457 RepID=UPI001C060EDD|nr:glycine--tRNA ligase subunit beta [Pelorhabdus rhamnosifermentans]MBU2701512.1 glycyl-tRNA synthetase beta chain [Pelorhabdus rhamnosifermentans]